MAGGPVKGALSSRRTPDRGAPQRETPQEPLCWPLRRGPASWKSSYGAATNSRLTPVLASELARVNDALTATAKPVAFAATT